MKAILFLSVIIGVPIGITFAMNLLKPKTKTNDETTLTDIEWDCEAQKFYKTRTYFNSPFRNKKA